MSRQRHTEVHTRREVLREELLRYLMDGYSITEATVIKKDESAESKHSKSTIHKVRLRIEEET